jgi:uncharacterized membrane protein YhaH (DUF805 family)
MQTGWSPGSSDRMQRYRFWIFLALTFVFLQVVLFAASRWHQVDLARDWPLLAVVEVVALVVAALIALKADHLTYEVETRRFKRRTGLFKR